MLPIILVVWLAILLRIGKSRVCILTRTWAAVTELVHWSFHQLMGQQYGRLLRNASLSPFYIER
jgi:hypothetical protein